MDQRSQKNIETLHPKARDWARAFLESVASSGLLPQGWSCRIISGNRTWKEQDELYAQGRTAPGQKVTNARGGQSNHNFGIAWDIGLFDQNGKYLTDHKLYLELGVVGRNLGLEWGGDWKSLKDFPHYQVKTGLSVAELRSLMQSGKPLPVPSFGVQNVFDAASLDKVTVLDNGKQTDILAFLETGRVWVSVRQFVDHFGGEVVSAEVPNFSVELHDEIVSFSGQVRDGVGYGKFADINRSLGWGFEFNGRTLNVKTGDAS